MPSSSASQPTPTAADFQGLLEISSMALALWRPLYGPDGAAVTDFACQYLNPAGQQLLSQPEQPKEPFLTLFPAARENGLFAFCCHVFTSGEPGQHETTHTPDSPDSSYRVTAQRQGEQLLAASFANSTGELRSTVEAALRASQAAATAARADAEQQRATLMRYLGRTHAAICVLRGPAHVLDYCNPTFERLFTGRALPIGCPLSEVFSSAVAQRMAPTLDGVYATGTSFFGVEQGLTLAATEAGPAARHYFTFSFDAYQEGGRTAGVSIFAYDVTEQVLVRQQLQEANRALTDSNSQLTRTNNDLDTFIYAASHDLKTPITNLEGLLHALREELPAALLQTDHVPPLLDRMQGAVDRFKLTIAQLTDLTKLQRADHQPAETVDLVTLVDDIRLDLDRQLTDAHLTVDVASCPQVSFAPKHLRSIVYNLLSNSLKYRHPDRAPLVQLRCRSTEDGTVVLDVRDNGLGLTDAQQGKLFGMFRRLHVHVEGSGIGLYMVKRIVENAGGTIAVQSTPDVGTTFTITLPAPAVAE